MDKKVRKAGRYFCVVIGPFPHYDLAQIVYYHHDEAPAMKLANYATTLWFHNFVRVYNPSDQLIFKWKRRKRRAEGSEEGS